MNPLEDIFGKNSRAVRRNVTLKSTFDAEGREVVETVCSESITLSPDGSIDRAVFQPDRFYHCGCPTTDPTGGKCGEPGCNRISCRRCFKRCQNCGIPLCLFHVRYVEIKNGTAAVVCADCQGALKRRQLLLTAAKGLLSPFVDFGSSKE